MADLSPDTQAHLAALADPNVSDADKHAHVDALAASPELAGLNIWQIISLAIQFGSVLVAVKGAIDAGQATSVGDPTNNNGPFSIYIDGKHEAVGPIPVAPWA